ncbi:hypothetical protein PIB30_098586 [Stylosanthes scabra]|uniref:Uncharacterized protein n=1 Tax=Stylosanthes scabra TaxID=79078 RepID=A0ABU6WXL3_9FABA|nr:hypothetical protein [Stylosanthes scabra]
MMLQSLGKSWKEARSRLFHNYYDPMKTLEQNVHARPGGTDEDHWRRFLRYRLRPDTKEKCRKNTVNRSKQLYTHTGGSKGMARRREEETCQQGRDVSRGEERIMDIEQYDESSRVLSQNDSLAQVLGKEHPGRVRGMGFGPIPSKLFGRNSQQTGEGAQTQETQMVLEELRVELTSEKLKRQAVESEVESEKVKRQAVESEVALEKVKRQAMENALRYLIQKQGGNLPADIIAGMNSLEGQP